MSGSLGCWGRALSSHGFPLPPPLPPAPLPPPSSIDTITTAEIRRLCDHTRPKLFKSWGLSVKLFLNLQMKYNFPFLLKPWHFRRNTFLLIKFVLWIMLLLNFSKMILKGKLSMNALKIKQYIQWNLVIKRSDITKPSYNKVILLVPALYISFLFYPDIMRNLI